MARYKHKKPVGKRDKLSVARWHQHKKRSWHDASAKGRYMRRVKGVRHAHVTLRSLGHFKFMRLCRHYTRLWKHKLTPKELAHIRAIHKEEIAATAIGWPWPNPLPRKKKPEQEQETLLEQL